MKKITALFLTAALSMAGAQNVTPAQIADTSLSNTNITIETGKYQGPLSSLLGAVAKSAGYELVLEVNVDNLEAEGGAVPVAYSFRDKPFNEVWPLLMDIYDLNYTVTNLGDQPVIRVNNTLVQRIIDLKAADPNYVVERAKVFFGSVKSIREQSERTQDSRLSTKQETADRQNDTRTTNTLKQGNEAASGTENLQSIAYNNVFETESLKVIADTVGDKVIIRGKNSEVQEVSKFVQNLDASAVAQREEQLAVYGNRTEEVREEIYRSNGDPAQIAEFITYQYPALAVRQLPNGTGLIIRGNSTVLDSALQLLTKIDPAPDGTTQEVFQLVNANAKEIAETLTDTLARQLSTAAANSGDSDENTSKLSTATVELAAKEPTIIADQRTNTLIVRGTPGQVAQISALIPTLDTRVPQVNLQVRIQEINESARNSLGVNWKAYAGGFEVGVAGSGINASFNPLRSVVGFNLFPALNALESQTMAKRIYDGSVTLQSGQRNLENAGIGSQDASSSAAATIRSGGRLEINIPGPTNGDNIEKTIPYGVILDFFDPIVAPDGTITVRVRGQINTIANQEALNAAVAQGVPPYLLQFLNSEAQTKISFQPGETVLLAGLSKVDESSTKEGLPFLSQIPGVGALAGSQASNKDNTEMLFVITADIIE